MKIFIITVAILLMSINTSIWAQTEQEDVGAFSSIPLYSFFHMYLEYATGELSAPLGERMLEQLDTKLSYNQNFNNARWLTFGFIAQASWNFGTDPRSFGGGATPKLPTPTDIVLSGTVGFINNIFTLAGSSKGDASLTVYYNKVLPKPGNFYQQDITILAAPTFFMPGDQKKDGRLTQGWFDKLEIRFAYRIKFNKYFGIRPEILLNISGTPLLAGRPFKDSVMFRFNPRIQAYYGDFSFFVEPRFFYFGDSSFFADKKNFQWEMKVGFDIAKFTLR